VLVGLGESGSSCAQQYTLQNRSRSRTNLIATVPGALQVVVMGNAALALGDCRRPVTEKMVAVWFGCFNLELPHYNNVRGFYLRPGSIYLGEVVLLTANGKLKRDAIVLSLEERDCGRSRSSATVAANMKN